MPESNADLARRGFAAALSGDLDTIRDLLDPEVKWHGGDPDSEGACRNRDQALKFMRGAGIVGRSAELVDVVEAGDKVVVILRPRAGASETVANVATFRDGRVVEMVHYPDPAAALSAARS